MNSVLVIVLIVAAAILAQVTYEWGYSRASEGCVVWQIK